MVVPFQKRPSKSIKNTGSYIFHNFTEGLYLLETPRTIGEQLNSLALLGGRNIFTEKTALVPQFGYDEKGKLPDNELIAAVTKDSLSASSFFILTFLGNVYYYSASQGLKKYKTHYTDAVTGSIISARRHNDMVNYIAGQLTIFGGYYNESNEVVIDEDATVEDITSFVRLTVPTTSKDYYWVDKQIFVHSNETPTKPIQLIINKVEEHQDGEHLILTCTLDPQLTDAQREETLRTLPATSVVGEKALVPSDLIFNYEEPDAEGKPRSKTITPVLMEVCTNRLCVVDVDGYIYYSAVGIVDNFNESAGAGFFGGFYHDSSNCLAMDDYKNGILITKRNGMYYLTISDTTSPSSVSANSSIGIKIEKVSEIGQEYATDHIVVGEKVYAYDSNSGSIVLAVQQNVFGSVVAGQTLIPSDYLDAVNLSISDSRRFLTYNKESEVMILYYGADLSDGLVITSTGSLFPRKLNKGMEHFVGLSQSVMSIGTDGSINRDFVKGTIVPDVSAVATFEAIGLLDSRIIACSLLEVIELNGVEYNITTTNTSTSYQKIKPYTNYGIDGVELPPLNYSNDTYKYELFGTLPDEEREELKELLMKKQITKWAGKKSNSTKIYAPMSGREGVSITFEFQPNIAFCLAAFSLLDFSQGN